MLLNLDYQEFIPDGFPSISFQVKPLSTDALQSIIRAVGKHQTGTIDGIDSKKGLEMLSDKEMFLVAERVFPDHVKDIKGIEIEEGGEKRAVDVEDLYKVGQLALISTALLMHLMAISMLSGEDVKN